MVNFKLLFSKSSSFYIQTLLIILFGSACSKEKEQNISIEFQKYVDHFFYEGNQRNLNLSLEDVDLTVRFGNVVSSAAGQCSFRTNIVTIDRLKWNAFSEEEKIWLIFHELGHCILNRKHKNEETKNEECLSIMRGDENSFECSINYYSNKWWSYYLDELFNESTSLPSWFNLNSDYSEILVVDTLYSLDTFAASVTINKVNLSLPDKFKIDFEFNNSNSSQALVKFYLGNIGFSNCDICSGTNVRISSDSPNRVYFQNYSGNIRFSSNIKLTICKKDKALSFFVNERFIHTMDQDLLIHGNIETIPMAEKLDIRFLITSIK